MAAEQEPIKYPLRVEVNGEHFLVERDPQQVGVHHYNWVSGPNTGYGFTTGNVAFDHVSGRFSHDHQPTLAKHLEEIRDFLGDIDPETGYLADD